MNVSHYSVEIIDDPKEIIKFLNIGTNIPVWPELYKYILYDFNYYHPKSLLLKDERNIDGHMLIFSVDSEILYFGYFRVINHNKEKIERLIKELIDYKQNNNYKIIRGPINIPAIIFGYGFMEEGSKESLFIAKPVNPPIYQKLFIDNGFKIVNEIVTWDANPMIRYDPIKSKEYDFTDYEYIYPKDLKDFNENFRNDFLLLHQRNLPPTALITPNVEDVIDNYTQFLFDYGYNFMIFFIRYKPSSKIIACGAYLPNPFRKSKKNIYDSTYVFTWVVEPEYRRKGIAFLMYGATSLLLWEKKVKYASGMISSYNKANTELAIKKLAGVETRKHILLEYHI